MKAAAAVETASAQLLARLCEVEEAAVERHTRALLRGLERRGILRDLEALARIATDGRGGGSDSTGAALAVGASPRAAPAVGEAPGARACLPAALADAPGAALTWFATAFELEPFWPAGTAGELPAGKARSFEIIEGQVPDRDDALVRVEVVAGGWKRRGVVVIPPAVRVVA
ncbi:MAG TPA: hypothetical protein VNK92_07445 [Vicinamibacterales bacterium]|nr:hypothetical protein [Vicinamibacterales bacterium]